MKNWEETKPEVIMCCTILTTFFFNIFYFDLIYSITVFSFNTSKIFTVLLSLPYIYFSVDTLRQKIKNPDNIFTNYTGFVLLSNLVFILSEVYLRSFIGLPTYKVIMNSFSLTIFVFFILQLVILKHRNSICFFCLSLALVNFLDIYSDGFLIKKIYEFIVDSGLAYQWSKNMSIDIESMKKELMIITINDIREFIKSLLLVSTSIIAVDRVWNLKVNITKASRKDDK